MSNQCSNLFNYRSLNLFPPFHTPLKPYSTTLRPVFPFHGNLVLIDRRSGSRKSSLAPPISAQSSSDVVLVATTEHHDGSLIFKFGDASELVKINEVKEIESKLELESIAVKVLDTDQEKGLVEKTIEEEYGSDTSTLMVADETTNADIDSDISERKSNVTSDLRDHNAESIEMLSHISEEEVVSFKSDDKMIESLEGVVRKLDEDESLNPNGDDKTDDELDSVKLESMQASDIEVMDVKQPYVEDKLQKVETEYDNKSNTEDLMPPANKDVNEEMEDMNINPLVQAVDVKVEAPREISSTECMDVKNQVMENELQEVSINKSDWNDVHVSSVEEAGPILEKDVIQPQSTPVVLKASMEVSDLELDDKMDQNPDDVILQTNNEIEGTLVSVKIETDELQKVEAEDSSDAEVMDPTKEDMEVGLQDMKINEGTFKDEIPPSDPSGTDVSQIQLDDVMLEAKPILEEEVSQPQSNPLELKPTMQVSDTELQDAVGLIIDDGSLEIIDETEDALESGKLETMQVSNIEVMDEVETKDTTESDAIRLMEAANGDMIEGLQDINIDGLTYSDTLEVEPTSNEKSQLQSDPVKLEETMEDELQQVNSNENDVEYVLPETVVEEEENQPCSAPEELKSFTIQVSIIEVEEDAEVQSIDDVMLQIKDVERSLHQLEAQLVLDEGVNVNNNILEQCDKIDALGNSILLENGSQLEAERIEDKVSSSEVAEASEETVNLLATKTQVEREEIYPTGYILSSGAALLDHPFRELTGGDDAYFVASSKWLGVASGVTQWSLEGTDPGVYAQELMRTCKDIVLNTTTVPLTNSVDLLCRGVKETNMSGSSNILIAHFNGQALHVANIGDTGFIIIRHGSVYKKSSPLLHEFHFALQVEDHDDPLQLVEEYIIELEEGDIVVSATDGLFDNLYEKEIAMVVSKSLQAGMNPEEVAKVLGTRAQEVGRSAFVRSPFSDAAQAAGYTGYSGGKPDKVAVIVSLVEKTC